MALKAEATYRHGHNHINFSLSVLFWKDGDQHFLFSPALDMTGYGRTVEEAKRSFNVQLDEFTAYTANKNTLLKELERLGWTVNKKKRRAKAPEYQEMLMDNEGLRDLSSRADVKHDLAQVALPL